MAEEEAPAGEVSGLGDGRMMAAALFAGLWAAGVPAVQDPPPPAPQERPLSEEQVLQRLANPLAALASFSLTADFDYHIGPLEEGHRTTMSVQPQVPLSLGEEWNIVSRTILPVIYQEETFPGAGNQFGVGDLTEAVYLVAAQPSRRGWIGGVGPIFRLPVGSDDLLSSKKWALGPSLALIRQQDDFTFGVIASQLWSFAGSDRRPDISVLTFDPFATWRMVGLWNLTLHLPSSYDFRADQWTIPAALTVEKLVSFQKAPVTISFGIRWWADGPDSGPHDLGFRFGLTLVFPK